MLMKLLSLLFVACLSGVVGFRLGFQRAGLILSASTMENGVSLSKLIDHESEADFLRWSVQEWLDKEFIVQPVHERIGSRCGEIYLSYRNLGVNDLGEMLIAVGTQLEGTDFGPAFVNPWDVANKVSDLLMVRMQRELCECSGDLSWALAYTEGQGAAKPLSETAIFLSSEFQRYRFLQSFLEGDVPLRSIVPIMALSLGFRDGPVGTPPTQDPALSPLCWERLLRPPDFANLGDDTLDARLADDLPEDSGGVDIALESLIGLESYKIMKKQAETQRDAARRIVLAKWLYAFNFFSDFPHTERFVPAHLEYRLEE